MARIGIKIHRIHVQKVRARKKLPFQVKGEHDPFSTIAKHLKSVQDKTIKHEVRADRTSREPCAVRFRSIECDATRGVIQGLCEVGPYGTREKLVNIDKLANSGEKGLREAVMRPFFFRIDVPSGAVTGLLTCGTRGVGGPKEYVERVLKDLFHRLDHTLKVTTYLDRDTLVAYLQAGGRASKLKVIGHKQKGDSRSLLCDTKINGVALGEEARVSVEFSGKGATAALSKFMKRVVQQAQKLGKGKSLADLRDLVEVYGLNTCESVETTIVLPDGTTRTIRLNSNDEAALSEDVSDEVKFSKGDGHPTYASMKKIAARVITSLGADAYLRP